MRGYDITGCEEPSDALCRTSSSTVNASLSGTSTEVVLASNVETGGKADGGLVSEGGNGDSNMVEGSVHQLEGDWFSGKIEHIFRWKEARTQHYNGPDMICTSQSP